MTKLSGGRLASFLKSPDPAVRAVLLFGPDQGLVRERADTIAGAIVGNLDDPFRVVVLSGASVKDEPARLRDEAAALSMTGGRRVVRVRDAMDGIAAVFAEFLADPIGESLIVVEAGELNKRSGLRRAFEEALHAAAVACYGDRPGELADLVRASLRERGVRIADDALSAFVDLLGADRLIVRSELEKLVLYAGEKKEIERKDVVACVGDSAEHSFDDIVYATCEGDMAGIDESLWKALAEGVSPVAVLRAAQRHLARVLLVKGLMQGGESYERATATLFPKPHFAFEERFRAHVHRWERERLAWSLDRVLSAELACTTEGLPQSAVCNRALIAVAQAASRRNVERGRR
ncbi:MAG: DNA polymerase III subunit delta [Rhodospirillales bacterium]|nr:DNA polymerase III subunit delta [Rhodospirillales bacterium]